MLLSFSRVKKMQTLAGEIWSCQEAIVLMLFLPESKKLKFLAAVFSQSPRLRLCSVMFCN